MCLVPLLFCSLPQAVTMSDSLSSQSQALARSLTAAEQMFAKVKHFTSASLTVFSLGCTGPDCYSLCEEQELGLRLKIVLV